MCFGEGNKSIKFGIVYFGKNREAVTWTRQIQFFLPLLQADIIFYLRLIMKHVGFFSSFSLLTLMIFFNIYLKSFFKTNLYASVCLCK